MRTKTKALKIARIANEKKGEDIVVLDVRKVCNFTDYFVLGTGQTTLHLRAICEEVNKKLRESEVVLFGSDGLAANSWCVMDYGDVLFHCFTEEARQYYDLERLWGDAPQIEWQKK